MANFRLRVALVPPSKEDDEHVAALRSHPETLVYLKHLPEHFSVSDACKRREECAADPRSRNFHIHLVTAPGPSSIGMSPLVGTCSLKDVDPANRSCEAGILISPAFHRTGLATESLYLLLDYAFTVEELHRVVFETSIDNIAMRGWFEHVLGIEFEAQLKDA